MRSSRRGKLAAVIVFLLIAIVVIGGMGWATVSSFELAKKTVTEDHNREISQAVLDMSSYMSGIIYAETSRKYSDYWARHDRKPLAAYGIDNMELDVRRVVLPSPLAETWPTNPWIDLYFLLDAKGVLSSPHLPEDDLPWQLDGRNPPLEAERRARQTWEWIRRVLPRVNLHERIALACAMEQDESPQMSASMSPPDAVPVSPAAERSDDSSSPRVAPYHQRQESYRKTQQIYLPQPACIDAEIAQRTADRTSTSIGRMDGATESDGGNVEIKAFPITAFWLGEGPNGHQKLAFVREVHWDAAVHYQGFIGDWSRLKPDLLRQIQHPLPGADLQPVDDDDEAFVESVVARMANLPVRLVVADVPGGVSSAAWSEVRGTLIITWMAAAAVLVVAGVGLRNLVALTERRMQFAYAVTHELRTPLTTFRLYSDMLSAGLVPDESKQEYVDTLNRESQRLSSLVEGVLEYARLENQRVRLTPEEVDAHTLLHGIAEHLQQQCDAQGVVAKSQNTLSNGQRVQTDVDVVNRIAGVLINNACRHARAKDDPTVLVRLGGENGMVHLDVADSGPGVERGDSRSIFKPFRRGRGADKAAHGGIGLGLALARNWATLLGGHLDLASRHHVELGGAHFRLTIPAKSTM